MRRSSRVPALASLSCLLACAGALAWSGLATADTLHTKASSRDGDFVPVEELSYEMILETGSDVSASQASKLALRVTVYNDSDTPQDALLALGLPRSSRLRSFATRRGGGAWEQGIAARNRGSHAQRDAGSIYARELPASRQGGLPRAELSAFALPAASTTQIELHLDVFPTLDGDRWSIDLPRRNSNNPNLAQERRVIVRGLGRGEQFFIDDSPSGTAKYMATRASDTVSLSWPAHLRGGNALQANLEVMRSETAAGKRAGDNVEGGEFRVALRLGASKSKTPDHVILVLDRSRSTATHMARASGRVFGGILDTLPADTTFEAIAFSREAQLLLGDTTAPAASDKDARMRLTRALENSGRGQGSDMGAAFELVGERLAARGAKRPLVVVVTDGMLPRSSTPQAMEQRLEAGRAAGTSPKAKSKAAAPQILFLIDDPLLEQSGLQADAPMARIAAKLGARIRLDTLASISRDDFRGLLASPQVLTDLRLDLPSNLTLTTPLPAGLVAGHVAVLEGRYTGRPPSQLTVRGRLGRNKVSQRMRAKSRAGTPEALVVPGDLSVPEASAAEGFALPAWYGASLARESELSISQVGYDTGPRRGRIDQDIVRRAMHMRVFPRAGVCYNRELATNQVLKGRVLFEVELGKGEVMHAKIAEQKFNYGVSQNFVDCLTEALWSLQVPAGKLDGDAYLVRYPLRFNPPEGGQAPSASDDPDPVFEMLMQRADTLSGVKDRTDSEPEDAPGSGPKPEGTRAPASHRPSR